MRSKLSLWLLPAVVLALTAGCGRFVARRMIQSPNTYPTWLAPKPRVELAYIPWLLTNFPAQTVEVGPPGARLQYRCVEPADYAFKTTSTNWIEKGHAHFRFSFRTIVPGRTNAWSVSPRGTVVLLHGYGLGEFAMVPWALRLAEEGWRSVLVDLRGHGASTGRQVYYGLQETRDLSQLLDALGRDGRRMQPIAVLGESYGAALALRWKACEPRLSAAVAIAPYAVLSNAVLNLCHDNARWLPAAVVRAGLRRLPELLQVTAAELDTTTVVARSPVSALLVAGAEDRVMPVADVRALYELCAPGSEFVVVPRATHEALPYFFDDLVPPVLGWLTTPDPVSGRTP